NLTFHEIADFPLKCTEHFIQVGPRGQVKLFNLSAQLDHVSDNQLIQIQEQPAVHFPDSEAFFSHEYHELIGLIYDAVTAEQGFFPFLHRFVQTFQGHSASFAIYNSAENSLVGAWTMNIPEEALRFYSEHVSHRDVLVERAK